MSDRNHGIMPFKGLDYLCRFTAGGRGRFGRLFIDLPPLYVDPTVLHNISKPSGLLADKGVPTLAKQTAAGLIFFGQFVDHDITLDASSSLTASNDPAQTENLRTPTLDLDCIYGDGPEAHPHLYLVDGKRLLAGADFPNGYIQGWIKDDDLPRTPVGKAIIGDPRNDENRVISQMQLGFLRFHNAVVTGGHDFEEARRVVRWHYQWIVVNEFLRTLCGDWIVDDIFANGRKVYRPECDTSATPFIPIEFSVAAYRFGHTMIPQKLPVKAGGEEHAIFGNGSVLGDGFEPLTDSAAVVEWGALLDDGSGGYKRAGKADAKLAQALLDLPFMITGPTSLAERNLRRGQSFLLPSGEQVARALQAAGADEIEDEMIKTMSNVGKKLGFAKGTPLWLYVLAEGRAIGRMGMSGGGVKTFDKGEGLGPVGARLVAEVIIGLLELDERAYLGANRNWSPFGEDKLGTDGVASLFQLLTYAQVAS